MQAAAAACARAGGITCGQVSSVVRLHAQESCWACSSWVSKYSTVGGECSSSRVLQWCCSVTAVPGFSSCVQPEELLELEL
jgi:hypothetical protein